MRGKEASEEVTKESMMCSPEAEAVVPKCIVFRSRLCEFKHDLCHLYPQVTLGE